MCLVISASSMRGWDVGLQFEDTTRLGVAALCIVGYNLYHHCTVALMLDPWRNLLKTRLASTTVYFLPVEYSDKFTLSAISPPLRVKWQTETHSLNEPGRSKSKYKLKEQKVEWHVQVELVLTKGRPSKSASPFTSCSFWIFWRAPDWAPSLPPLSDQNILSAPSDTHAILTDISLSEISSDTYAILSDITLSEISSGTHAILSDISLSKISSETHAILSDISLSKISSEAHAILLWHFIE